MNYKTQAEAQAKADALNAKYGKVVYRVVADEAGSRYRVTTR